ncbi:MAG: hypothetical protein AB1589_17720 [Cyanobacteriota bacterium]
MIKYQTNQLEAADEFLRLLGIPGPYTFKEKIRTLEVSQVAVESRLHGSLESCYISIREVATKICKDIYADRLKQKYSYPRELCFVDWRDDLESFSLI